MFADHHGRVKTRSQVRDNSSDARGGAGRGPLDRDAVESIHFAGQTCYQQAERRRLSPPHRTVVVLP